MRTIAKLAAAASQPHDELPEVMQAPQPAKQEHRAETFGEEQAKNWQDTISEPKRASKKSNMNPKKPPSATGYSSQAQSNSKASIPSQRQANSQRSVTSSEKLNRLRTGIVGTQVIS